MDFALSDEQEMLRASAREVLARHCPSSYIRRVMGSDDAWDPDMWRRLAGLGWTGLGIPEEYGGAGTFLDLAVVMEEAGRALLPGPLFATMGLAVPVLLEAGSEAQKRQTLSRIAAGEARATVAQTEAEGRWDAAGVRLGAVRSGAGWRLDGVKRFVPDAAQASHTVVVARTGTDEEAAITLFLVSGRPAGMTVTALQTMDATRRWYDVRLEGVELPAGAVLGTVGGGWSRLRRALDWSSAALCAEMVGGAQRVLDSSVEYAKARRQFGKPIGAYQAVSHRLADTLVETESARSLTYYAAWAVAADAADRGLASSLAKAYASDAYTRAAATSVQVHGGIGFTWEHDAHLHLKRAKAAEVTLGGPTFHRELVAQALDL
jgi:alkylation response protein AidB-like acyl-CoA dehydrogenase